MKLVGTETIVLVTGSGPAQLARDRAHALRLQEEIDGRGSGLAYRRAVLVTDARYLGHADFHRQPTIAIGGPGVNGVSQALLEDLPTVWSEGERSFVQLEVESAARASLWGLDAGATARAVEAFVQERFLDQLLERAWPFRPWETA